MAETAKTCSMVPLMSVRNPFRRLVSIRWLLHRNFSRCVSQAYQRHAISHQASYTHVRTSSVAHTQRSQLMSSPSTGLRRIFKPINKGVFQGDTLSIDFRKTGSRPPSFHTHISMLIGMKVPPPTLRDGILLK